MASRRLLVDTSILIDFLRKEKKDKSILWKLEEDRFMIYVSAVTVFEIYFGAKTSQHKKDASRLLSTLKVIPFDNLESKKAADIMLSLKKKNDILEFRDVFIAATAIKNDLELCTLNLKDFEKISDLNIYNL